MKNIYSNLIRAAENGERLALATLLETRGSVPQVRGATALFSGDGLMYGTLGGGVLEGHATGKAAALIKQGSREVYDFDLNADISAREEAICGGSATILIDACVDRSLTVFREMENSIRQGKSGVLVTSITGKKTPAIERMWLEEVPGEFPEELQQCLLDRKCLYEESPEGKARFLEPVFPLPHLVIAGAGHIGRALAHLGNLLDFEVTVVDDRSEYANPQNIPDADSIVVEDIGKALREIPKSPETYIVIVTRGHKDDGEALKACLDDDVAYIGMIGSRRKIQLMREEFISLGWATAARFDGVHAPIGLPIGSKTVQEIAVSIGAQLVQVRQQRRKRPKPLSVTAIILGAGTSSRMGKPKLLLPFGESTVFGTVISHVLDSSVERVIVVLGANYDIHYKKIRDYAVDIVHNPQYNDGMFSSLQCGLGSVGEDADAVLVLLGDQPMIRTADMEKLIDAYRHSENRIMVATHGEKRGHPVLFGRGYINELKGYSKEASLRDLLQNHSGEILEIETGNEKILRDIDTESDYQYELKQHHKHD